MIYLFIMNIFNENRRSVAFVVIVSLLLAVIVTGCSNTRDESVMANVTGAAVDVSPTSTGDAEPGEPATDASGGGVTGPESVTTGIAIATTDAASPTGSAQVAPGATDATGAPGTTSMPAATSPAILTTYGAFTSSYAATMYLPGTKMIRIQPIRTYLDRSKPMIALTFDDGPSQYTGHIVELLAKYDCRATFCVLGNRVKPQADRVRAVAAQGSEVMGHSWDHKNLTALSKKKIRRELKRTNYAIKSVTGVRPTMYRPPYGAYDKEVLKVSKKLNLALLTWSLDTKDWKSLDPKRVYIRIKKYAERDQILLMHDIHESTAEAMDKVIPWLVNQGYELVTVSELMYYKDIKIKPGKIYNDGLE
ncbi:MAG: polysaccharide deacetylase family protein [Clostridiales Family XIII bacterium]|jgi:peptidoglycan/xylan/chitin deacetylase (PgdA/CDA1 family)|nr:polysaccharide deacetylase family protein [Clostridiales Family XIII bacterium]